MINKFINLCENHTQVQLANYFGVSVPSIARWNSDKKIPKYAEIILSLKSSNEDLMTKISLLQVDEQEQRSKVNNFIHAFEALK